MDQSDAEGAGVLSRRTNRTQATRAMDSKTAANRVERLSSVSRRMGASSSASDARRCVRQRTRARAGGGRLLRN
eukprot:6243370-Pyramimonas_sp.AAC.1